MNLTARGAVQDGPLDGSDNAAIAFTYNGKLRTLRTRLRVAEAMSILAALARRLPFGAIGPGVEN